MGSQSTPSRSGCIAPAVMRSVSLIFCTRLRMLMPEELDADFRLELRDNGVVVQEPFRRVMAQRQVLNAIHAMYG